MNTIKIYGAYAEGYVFKGSVELSPVEPCSSVLDIKEAYASLNIDIAGGIPVVLNLNNNYLSIYSEDSTMSVLKEYPGAQLVSKNEVGYKMVMAD